MKLFKTTAWLPALIAILFSTAVLGSKNRSPRGKGGKGGSSKTELPSQIPSPIPSTQPSNSPSSLPSNAPTETEFELVDIGTPDSPYKANGSVNAAGGVDPFLQGISNFCEIAIVSLGVWFRVVGDGKYITAATCDPTPLDTRISVFSGDELEVCVGGNDDVDYPQDRSSSFTWRGGNEKNFYILVHGYAGAEGDFTLCVSSSSLRPGEEL